MHSLKVRRSSLEIKYVHTEAQDGNAIIIIITYSRVHRVIVTILASNLHEAVPTENSPRKFAELTIKIFRSSRTLEKRVLKF